MHVLCDEVWSPFTTLCLHATVSYSLRKLILAANVHRDKATTLKLSLGKTEIISVGRNLWSLEKKLSFVNIPLFCPQTWVPAVAQFGRNALGCGLQTKRREPKAKRLESYQYTDNFIRISFFGGSVLKNKKTARISSRFFLIWLISQSEFEVNQLTSSCATHAMSMRS